MSTVAKKSYYKRRYYKKFRRYRSLRDQVVRMKLDYGAIIGWPLESGPVVFDNVNSQFKDFDAIESESYEIDPARNIFTQFFGKKKVYGVKIVVTPIKQLEREQGVSTYIGYQLGKNHGTLSIDAARAMSSAFQCPCYGGTPMSKFVRIYDNPWMDARDLIGGFFFVVANSNGIRGEMPQWEARLSIYMKYKNNSL